MLASHYVRQSADTETLAKVHPDAAKVRMAGLGTQTQHSRQEQAFHKIKVP